MSKNLHRLRNEAALHLNSANGRTMDLSTTGVKEGRATPTAQSATAAWPWVRCFAVAV